MKSLFKNINSLSRVSVVLLAILAGLFVTGICYAGYSGYKAYSIHITQQRNIDDNNLEEISKSAPEATTQLVETTVSQSAPQSTPQPVAKPQSIAKPKPYVAGVCTKTVIPYKTIYKDASWLDVGKTEKGFGGMDGYVEKCTAASTGYIAPDYTWKPVDLTVWVGTRQPTPTSTPEPIPSDPAPQYTYAEALAMSESNCEGYKHVGSTAWAMCMSSSMKAFGYHYGF